MKNFPHQFGSLEKINGSFLTYCEFLSSGSAPSEKQFSDALVRNGVYAFRNLGNQTIEERLAEEHQKPVQNQGARTCARDLTRFLTLAGFIGRNGELTDSGQVLHVALKESADDTVFAAWRAALRSIELPSEQPQAVDTVSHPYTIMLKLLGFYPGIQRKKLALAFAADDDSEEEFARICNIVLDDEQWEKWSKTVRKTAIDNAVKILPSLAKDVGDWNPQKRIVYHEYCKLDNSGNTHRPTPAKRTACDIASIPIFSTAELELPRSCSKNPSDTIALQQKRTQAHHELVKTVAKELEAAGYEFYENPMDCLAIKQDSPALLFEMKTILKDHSDEMTQVRLALAQLFYYEFFDLTSDAITPARKIAVFDRKISNRHIEFLNSYGCQVCWLTESGMVGLDDCLN